MRARISRIVAILAVALIVVLALHRCSGRVEHPASRPLPTQALPEQAPSAHGREDVAGPARAAGVHPARGRSPGSPSGRASPRGAAPHHGEARSTVPAVSHETKQPAHPEPPEAAPGTGAGAQVPVPGERAGLEEGLFQLRVHQVPGRLSLVTLIDSTGKLLIPLWPVLRQVGIPTSHHGSDIVLEWPPEVWRTTLDVARREIVTGGDTLTYPAAAWVKRGDQDYVSSDVLARILAARVDVDWTDLVIVVSENPEFPATKRLELEAQRSRDLLRQGMLSPDRFADLPYQPRTGGWAAGWGLSLSDGVGPSRETFQGTVGASILGGGLEAGTTGLFGEGERPRTADGFARYTRVFPTSRWVRSIEVGSVLGQGSLARRITGFSVTNQPFTMPRYFGQAAVTPAVPSGWEYEVYQGEQLVGVATSGSPAAIRTPLNYGNTPVHIRLIGPAGQEVDQQIVYMVPEGRVPAHDWRYTIEGGRCEDPGCDTYYLAELLRGVTPWLTAGAGVDRVAEGGDVDTKPLLTLGISPRPDVSVDFRARQSSFLRADLAYAAGPRGSVNGSYTWSAPGAGQGFNGWSGQLAASGPVSFAGGRWFGANLLLRGLERNELDSWQGSVSTTIRRTHLDLDFESGLQAHALATLRVFHTLVRNLPKAFEDASWSGALGASRTGPVLAEVGMTVRTAQRALLDAQIRLRRGTTPMFSLGFSIRTNVGFMQARGSRGGGPGMFVSADGGLAYDPETGVMGLPYQSVGRAGVSGDVFYDLNGDGRREAGEPPVTEATVIVDGQRRTTDAKGRFRAWELTPYDASSVALDSLSVDPEWAPSRKATLLRPSPNLFAHVTLAVHRTRELLGSVVSADSVPRPLAGVPIEILDGAGRVVASSVTFSDGVFYVERLRPGRYRIRVTSPGEPGAVQPVEVEFEVPSGEGPAVRLAPITLGRTSSSGG